jgi:ribosomal protein S18 acetylase RimI-like enzyme
VSINVRRATADEWELVRDIRLAALQEAPYAFGSTYARERDFDEETWRGRLNNPDHPTFLAFDGDKPVGLDGVYVENDDRILVAMWVAPGARRSGVGSALTTAVCEWVKAQGGGRLYLGVAEDNEPARFLYERLGFKMTGKSQPLHSDPSRQTLEMAIDLD